LVLSSSTATFQDDGSPSLIQLISDALRRRQPDVEWHLAGALLLTTGSMRQRALASVEEHVPDVVVLRPTGLAFMHDDVASRVKQRWPRYYRLCLRLARFADDISGRKAATGTPRRRLLFDLPRWLAAKVIGVAPPVSPEDAARFTTETLDALLSNEHLTLLCRISVGNVDSNAPPGDFERRVETYARTVREQCQSRYVPFADNRERFELSARAYAYAPDRTHPALRLRSIEAEAIAQDILTVTSELPLPARG
jgi:hypothetical protein